MLGVLLVMLGKPPKPQKKAKAQKSEHYEKAAFDLQLDHDASSINAKKHAGG